MAGRRPIALATGLVVIAGVAVAAMVFWPQQFAPSIELRPDDAAVVSSGEQVYAANCASCHGTDLGGQPNWRERGADGRLPAPPHDETGHTWHHPDQVLFQLTKFGLPKEIGNGEPYYTNMPAYETVLTDDEIVAVLSYIKSRWPEDVRARHDRLNDQLAVQ